MSESTVPTPWAVRCPYHGVVYLTENSYIAQLSRPDSYWECPHFVTPEEAEKEPNPNLSNWASRMIGYCGVPSLWQDDIYQAYLDSMEY